MMNMKKHEFKSEHLYPNHPSAEKSKKSKTTAARNNLRGILSQGKELNSKEPPRRKFNRGIKGIPSGSVA